jgi:hypothetical protein
MSSWPLGLLLVPLTLLGPLAIYAALAGAALLLLLAVPRLLSQGVTWSKATFGGLWKWFNT